MSFVADVVPCVTLDPLGTALPATVLNTSGLLRIAMALHFVSYGFCGLANFALLETSAGKKL